ncbi:MAG: hypothetical protein QXP36_02045 [Conexivisphaerales archaeon]
MNIQSYIRTNNAGGECVGCSGIKSRGIVPQVKVLGVWEDAQSIVIRVYIIKHFIHIGDYIRIKNKLYCIANMYINFQMSVVAVEGETVDLVVRVLDDKLKKGEKLEIVVRESVIEKSAIVLLREGIIKDPYMAEELAEAYLAEINSPISAYAGSIVDLGISALPVTLSYAKDILILGAVAKFAAVLWNKYITGCQKYSGRNKYECLLKQVSKVLERLDQQTEQCDKFVDERVKEKCFRAVDKERQKWVNLSLKYQQKIGSSIF